jgi:sporulation protein YlmC with PRC-barrel domain
MPFDMVRAATEDKVVLKEDVDDFERLPPFEERHYVEADQHAQDVPYPTYKYARAYYLYPPVGYLGYPAYGLRPYSWPPVETERNIPENTVALKEGTEVLSSDNTQVGKIEHLFIQPESGKVSHILVSEGVLRKDRRLVPVAWVESVAEDKVLLSMPSRQLEGLPAYKD